MRVTKYVLLTLAAIAVLAAISCDGIPGIESGYPTPPPHDPEMFRSYSDEVPLCTPIEGSSVDPCEPGVSIKTTAFTPPGSEWVNLYDSPATIQEILQGDSVVTVSHLAVRGTFTPNSVRCVSGAPYHIPAYVKPGLFRNSVAIQCYADIRANGYLIGRGPPNLTVLVSFLHYWDGYYADVAQAEGKTEAEIVETIRLAHIKTLENDPGIYGREAVLFVGTPHNLAVEVWELYALWDIQELEDDSFVVIHPHRDVGRRKGRQTIRPTRRS